MKKNKSKISNINKINIVIHNNIKKKKKIKNKSKIKNKKGLLQLGYPSQYPMQAPVSTPYSFSLPLPQDNTEAKSYSKSYNMLIEDKKNDINNNILNDNQNNNINNNLIKDNENNNLIKDNNNNKLENIHKIKTLKELRLYMKKIDPTISDELLKKITTKNKQLCIDQFLKKQNKKYNIIEVKTPQPINSEFEEQIPLTQSNNSFIDQTPVSVNNNLIDQTPVSVNNKEEDYYVSEVKPRKQSKKAEKFTPKPTPTYINDIDDKSIHLSNYKNKLRSYNLINRKIELEDTINKTYSSPNDERSVNISDFDDGTPSSGNILDFNDE